MSKNKSLVLHAILQSKKKYKSKKDALNDARQHFENQKIKGFVRETTNQYRVRVIPKTKFIKTEYVSKKISPNTTLVFGKLKGGAVIASDVNKFVEESYKKPKEASKQIGDYKLDKDLSTKKAKVYHDPKTNKTIVANRGTTGTFSDWSNNLRYGADIATGNIFNLYNKSDRMKQAEKVQKEAIKKYGKVDTNIGHSQSGIITRELNKQGLTNEVININPASFFEKPKKNEKTYRSKYDPVSIFSRGAKTLKGPINPLKAHSSSFLKKSKKLLGGNINEEIITYFNTYKSIVESGEKPAQITKQINKLIDSIHTKKIYPSDRDDFFKLVRKYKEEHPIIKKPKTPKEKKEVNEAKKEAKRIAKEEKEALKFPKGYEDIDKKRFLTAERYIKKLLKEGKFEELKEDEEYNIKFISSEYAENPKYKRMSENLIHILLDDGLAKPEKPIKTPKIPKIKEVISKKKVADLKKTDKKEELQKLLNEISNTKIKEKVSNINKEEGDKLLNKIDKIQKNKKADEFRKKQLLKKALKAIKEDKKPKEEDKPFNLDNFDEVNGYDLMLYKKNYYLRDLETSEIYNIKNNKPFEKVGLYNIQKKRIILDKKPEKPEIPVIPQVKTKEEKNKIADEFRKKQLLKKAFERISKEKKPKEVFKIRIIHNKRVNPEEFTKSRDFKVYTFDTEDGNLFYFDNKKDYDTAKGEILQIYNNKDFKPIFYSDNEEDKNKKADEFRKKQLLKKALKAIKEDKKPKEEDRETRLIRERDARAEWRKKYKKERDEISNLQEKIDEKFNKERKTLDKDLYNFISEKFQRVSSKYSLDSDKLFSDFEKYKKEFNNIIKLFKNGESPFNKVKNK